MSTSTRSDGVAAEGATESGVPAATPAADPQSAEATEPVQPETATPDAFLPFSSSTMLVGPGVKPELVER